MSLNPCWAQNVIGVESSLSTLLMFAPFSIRKRAQDNCTALQENIRAVYPNESLNSSGTPTLSNNSKISTFPL
jgi:hypothetical protein